MMKYVSLLCLTLQNALLVLVMRYSRTRDVSALYITSTTVIMAELTKFIFCNILILAEEGWSVRKWWQHIVDNILSQPMDCLKISVPSLVYVLQNNLLFIAVSNLDAATFQVSYQLKILTTAIFSVAMLGKELSKMQWFSLVILFLGVSLVQLQSGTSTPSSTSSGPIQSPTIGMVAVVISCIMSGFAGVYFEKVLKSTKQSLWVRNVQLGFIGVFLGLVTMAMKDGAEVYEHGFFYGYDWLVYFVVLLNSLGGLMVAVVVKYADNILKGFATSAAIVLSSVASVYFFAFHMSLQFVIGAGLVVSAVYLYGKFPKITIMPLPKVISQ